MFYFFRASLVVKVILCNFYDYLNFIDCCSLVKAKLICYLVLPMDLFIIWGWGRLIAFVYLDCYENFLIYVLCYYDLLAWQFNLFAFSSCYLFLYSIVESFISTFFLYIYSEPDFIPSIMPVYEPLVNPTFNGDGLLEVKLDLPKEESAKIVDKSELANHRIIKTIVVLGYFAVIVSLSLKFC